MTVFNTNSVNALPSLTRLQGTPPHFARPWPLPLANSPRIDRLVEQLEVANQQGEPVSSIINAFIDQIRGIGAPLVEPSDDPDKRLVTFIYRGVGSDRVYLDANRITDPFNPCEAQLVQLVDTDIATLTLKMPADWICTYSYFVADQPLNPTHRLSTQQVLHNRSLTKADQLNPNVFGNKNSPGEPRSIVILDKALAEPEISNSIWRQHCAPLTLPVSGCPVEVTIRSHPDAQRDCPAVLLTDGDIWLADSLDLALDHLIAEAKCPPVHLLYLPAGNANARQIDYIAAPDDQAALFDALAAVLRQAIPGWNGHWLVAGQSLGGLFALLAAVRFPDLLIGAVAQSPSLWWPTLPAPQIGAGQWFSELGKAGDCAPCVIQVGGTEWVLQASVMHAREFLRALNRLVETPNDVVSGGHDMAWWRRSLPGALELVLKNSLG